MRRPRRLFYVPEVIQMSAMDCGPASLKSMLDGFRVDVDYDALRQACRTDVDGTSMNELERMARAMGLDAKQIVVPADHVLLDEARALPAIAVLRHPNGNTHFAVIWSGHGGLVQMMDPAAGRLWRSRGDVVAQLHRHTAAVDANAWRKWAGSEGLLRPLRRRIRKLGIADRAARTLIESALADSAWRSIAALDAGTRSVQAVVDAAGVRRLSNAAELLRRYVEEAEAAALIPDEFWLVRQNADDAAKLDYRGAVLLRARGVLRPNTDAAPTAGSREASGIGFVPDASSRPGSFAALIRSLRSDGALNPLFLLFLFAVNAAGLTVQALLLRSFFAVGSRLASSAQLAGAMLALLALMLILFAQRFASAHGIYRAARRVEMYFRALVLRKVPRLGDRYFQTRLPADVAERSHSIVGVRLFPFVAARIVSCALEIAITAAAIVWFDRALWPFAFAAAAVAMAVPLLAQPAFGAHELRVRLHTAILGHFYLDTLSGVPAIRAHAAHRAIRRQHDSLLAEWARAAVRMVRLNVSATAFQMILTLAIAAALVLDYVRRHGDASGALLLVFWVLQLPFLAAFLAEAIQSYQSRKNAVTRVMELVYAPEETPPTSPDRAEAHESGARPPGGVAIEASNVTVRLSGQRVLEDVTFRIEPGQHVAIVGPSGAGKSTLVGLLLGWSRGEAGTVLVDDEPLTAARLDALRSETAWVDPGVHIWNRTLFENVAYGSNDVTAQDFGDLLHDADLLTLLQSFPDGLQTRLGEGGGLVSGGEGQRVRLARAMCRRRPRLAILDEPLRGLDHGRRLDLLQRARRTWAEATLLCITHDISATRQFDRVMVVERGRIAEQGVPGDLAKDPRSRYASLLEADEQARQWWRRSNVWRRFSMSKGVVVEQV